MFCFLSAFDVGCGGLAVLRNGDESLLDGGGVGDRVVYKEFGEVFGGGLALSDEGA